MKKVKAIYLVVAALLILTITASHAATITIAGQSVTPTVTPITIYPPDQNPVYIYLNKDAHLRAVYIPTLHLTAYHQVPDFTFYSLLIHIDATTTVEVFQSGPYNKALTEKLVPTTLLDLVKEQFK